MAEENEVPQTAVIQQYIDNELFRRFQSLNKLFQGIRETEAEEPKAVLTERAANSTGNRRVPRSRMNGTAMQSYSIGNKENSNSNNVRQENTKNPATELFIDKEECEMANNNNGLKNNHEELKPIQAPINEVDENRILDRTENSSSRHNEQISALEPKEVTLSESCIAQQKANSTIDTVTEVVAPQIKQNPKIEQGLEKLSLHFDNHKRKIIFKKLKNANEAFKLKKGAFEAIIRGLLNTTMHKKFMIWYYRSTTKTDINPINYRTISRAFGIIEKAISRKVKRKAFFQWTKPISVSLLA